MSKTPSGRYVVSWARRALLAGTAALAAVALASPLGAQGRTDYFNVESPQVHPIEVMRLGGHDYVVVCNTRDNSLEVWDTDETVSEAPAGSRAGGPRAGVGALPRRPLAALTSDPAADCSVDGGGGACYWSATPVLLP